MNITNRDRSGIIINEIAIYNNSVGDIIIKYDDNYPYIWCDTSMYDESRKLTDYEFFSI